MLGGKIQKFGSFSTSIRTRWPSSGRKTSKSTSFSGSLRMLTLRASRRSKSRRLDRWSQCFWSWLKVVSKSWLMWASSSRYHHLLSWSSNKKRKSKIGLANQFRKWTMRKTIKIKTMAEPKPKKLTRLWSRKMSLNIQLLIESKTMKKSNDESCFTLKARATFTALSLQV